VPVHVYRGAMVHLCRLAPLRAKFDGQDLFRASDDRDVSGSRDHCGFLPKGAPLQTVRA
jgi:hypothetical protein